MEVASLCWLFVAGICLVKACFGCVGHIAPGFVVVSRCMSLLDMLLVVVIDPIGLLELLWSLASFSSLLLLA